MTMTKQNKSKIKMLTVIKSFSLLFSLKANSCMFWSQPQVRSKASRIHKLWLSLVHKGGWRIAAGGNP